MSAAPPSPESDREALRAVAELAGVLLLRELDGPALERLRAPGVAAALAERGLVLPEESTQEAWLDDRAAEYHDRLLRPDAGPLVQSLWTEGRYEGEAAARVRKLAEHAGVTFQREQARGAAVDHLGSLLLLWAATDEHAPAVAAEIARKHLAWAGPGLASLERGGGFYGGVAALAGEAIGAVRATDDRA